MALFQNGLDLLQLNLLVFAELFDDFFHFISPIDQIDLTLHILEQRHLDLEDTALSQEAPIVVSVSLVVALLLLFVERLNFKFPFVYVRDLCGQLCDLV